MVVMWLCCMMMVLLCSGVFGLKIVSRRLREMIELSWMLFLMKL